jgi:hypothetical protein
MWTWILSFIKGKALNLVGIIADILIVAFIGYMVWQHFHPKPTTTQNQKAETIYNYTYTCKALIGWGCGNAKATNPVTK